MSLPIVLAKSLLSLTLLSAAVPAGGELMASSSGKGDADLPSSGAVYTVRAAAEGEASGTPGSMDVTRSVTLYDGADLMQTTVTPIPNPLELAKTYAPETVEEWTRTLEQFKETLKLQVYRVSLKDTPEGTEDVTLSMGITIHGIAAVRSGVAMAEDAAGLQPGTVEIRPAAALEEGATDRTESVVALPAVSVFPLDEEIVKAEAALAKTLEAGEKEAIRTALHDLLTAYQVFLANK